MRVARVISSTVTLLAALAWLAIPVAVGAAQQPPAIAVKTLADKKVTTLPAGPLFFHIETFPTRAAAEAAAGPTSLVVEEAGTVYLVTLAPAGDPTTGGTAGGTVGPVQVPRASEFLLRVSELAGPPGAQAGVHTHPGAEAYLVLAGQLSVRSPSGVVAASAGETMVGPPGGTAMQPLSTGSVPLLALAFFAVDANQPFSSPAVLGATAAPAQVPAALPRTGDAGSIGGLLLGAAGAAALGAGALLRHRRRGMR